MHRIQRPESRPWVSRDTVSARSFLQQCSEHGMEQLVSDATSSLADFLQDCHVRSKNAELQSVTEDCDPRHLECPEEAQVLAGNVGLGSDWLHGVQLQSVRWLQQHPGMRPGNVDYDRLQSESALDTQVPLPSTCPAFETPVPMPPAGLEAVVVLQVFRPMTPVESKKANPIADMEMEVLASQTLMDVRRSLCCASDLNSSVSSSQQSRSSNGSAFFFIEDTFYNDTPSGCVDYSEGIVKWSHESGRGIRPFTVRDMYTRLADLQLRLGLPYLYVHQGDCEHWIVAKDVRLLLHREVDLSQYPKMKPLAQRNQICCELCRTNVARWTTRGNLRMPTDPSFFCDECHRRFNQEAEKRRPTAGFQSQTFVDKSVLL